jgi:ABC-type glycerol-3-phosphate transport system substrate-binding protein
MIDKPLWCGLTVGMALIAGTAVLAGCGGPEPVTRTTTTEQTTTTTPPPPATSTTTTTTQQTQRP